MPLGTQAVVNLVAGQECEAIALVSHGIEAMGL